MARSVSVSIQMPHVLVRTLGAIIASILIGMAAPVTIFLPFTPIPFTFQVHLVFLLSSLFGPYYSLVMVGSFLLQGFMGLPVFAGGLVGSLLSPSFGYLIGYAFAARYLGMAFQRKSNGYMESFFRFSMANLIVYAFGVCYLQMFVGPYNALLYGVVPFLLTDLVKNILLARFVHPLKKIYETTL